MNKIELIKLVEKAKQVAVAVGGYNQNHFDCVRIYPDGCVSAYFTGYARGSWEDSIDLTEEDITLPIEETVAKHEKKAQELAELIERKKIEEAQKQKIIQDKKDLATYLKLKEKFNNL